MKMNSVNPLHSGALSLSFAAETGAMLTAITLHKTTIWQLRKLVQKHWFQNTANSANNRTTVKTKKYTVKSPGYE
ncbi:hypothetical protein C5Y96_06555 [Blastopirellula marina]|uniref:Uncharacterized protein n=1 Tax=Blastopirellula marina TaxID=124 RepID=A0A2S8FXD9_9BACT|nr:hypothetical protein C5Y96_06555 [Blastopirellula marina]RCS53538.1 hypothetical protein DTL36_06565 [Bremerella cremea]